MSDPIDRIPQDDWVDQDLLTRDSAGALLDREIAAEHDRINRVDRGENGDDIIMTRADMQRRITAMIAARDRVRKASS